MTESTETENLTSVTIIQGLTTPGAESEPDSKARKILKTAGWIGLGIFFMIFFTLTKLPEDKVRNYIQGTVASTLAGQGIGLTAGKSNLSILLGISYTMKDVTLTFPPPAETLRVDEISVSPSLLPLLIGRLGGSFKLTHGSGTLSGSFAMRGAQMSASYSARRLDLGKMGLVAALANVKVSGVASGEGEISGDWNTPATLGGTVRLDLSNVVLEQQSIMGFSIPRAAVAEGKVDIAIDKGKATIRTLRLGKAGSTTDDLHANLTGDMTLAKQLPYSTLNIKAEFGFSQTILKSFVLLDALLGPGKQADGSYAFNLTGPLSAPYSNPVSPGAK